VIGTWGSSLGGPHSSSNVSRSGSINSGGAEKSSLSAKSLKQGSSGCSVGGRFGSLSSGDSLRTGGEICCSMSCGGACSS
jgi:hypothetical protein